MTGWRDSQQKFGEEGVRGDSPELRAAALSGCGFHLKPLTQRDILILQNAADGFRYEDTAVTVGLKRGYVKVLAGKAFVKMGADNLTHAVALGFRRGLLR